MRRIEVYPGYVKRGDVYVGYTVTSVSVDYKTHKVCITSILGMDVRKRYYKTTAKLTILRP